MKRPSALAAEVRALDAGRRLTSAWTAGELVMRLDDLVADLHGHGIRPGEAVGLPLCNGDDWILALLALLETGARPVLIAPEASPAERNRVLEKAGGRRSLEADHLRLTGEPGLDGEPGGVLLVTSGPTGALKLVHRTEDSLRAEADRYVSTLALDGTGHLLLPLPLHHAYPLGWLAAALRCGMRVTALPPTNLNPVAACLRDGATLIALFPAMARLLAMRQLGRPLPHPAPELRMAMVGAGPVDAELDDMFRRAFGTPTARTYGSAETGAVFAGPAPQPPLSVGPPMPGVEFQVIDEDEAPCPPGTTGTLCLRWEPGMPWHDTEDLVTFENGRLIVLGRRHRAVRRGGQWVSPLEVEEVLRQHPDVLDACVTARANHGEGEYVLIADVQVADPNGIDAAALDAYARKHLAPRSLPQEIWVYDRLAHHRSGRVRQK